MERYFFNFSAGSTSVKDTCGAVLAPSQVMQAAAKIVENMTLYREFLCNWAEGVIRVEDKSGRFLAILSVPALFAYDERSAGAPARDPATVY
jgi:hypothetical protein